MFDNQQEWLLIVVIDLTPELDFFKQESPVIIVNKALVQKEFDGIGLENIHQWPHFVDSSTTSYSKNKVGEDKIDLTALLSLLAQRGLNDVLIESGAKLAGAFIEQNLADELILYQAPKLMGGDGKSLVEMPNVISLSQAKALSITDVRQVGCDIRITAKLKKAPE